VGLVSETEHFRIPKGDDELSDLIKCITAINVWAKSDSGLGDTQYGDKWSQLYFPAASVCYAYEPLNLKPNETLNPKFAKHNWFLPTLGLLARMAWYSYDYSTGTNVVKEGGPLDTVINSLGTKIFEIFSKSVSFYSSTEQSNASVYDISFLSGNVYSRGKNVAKSVRAVCAF
jgi:hypothetical protein